MQEYHILTDKEEHMREQENTEGYEGQGTAEQGQRKNLPGWAVIVAGLAMGAGLIWAINKATDRAEKSAAEAHEWPEPNLWG